MLIKPTRVQSNSFGAFILDDGMRLYLLKINAAEYIIYSVDNTYKSKLSIETQYNLNLEDKFKEIEGKSKNYK